MKTTMATVIKNFHCESETVSRSVKINFKLTVTFHFFLHSGHYHDSCYAPTFSVANLFLLQI